MWRESARPTRYRSRFPGMPCGHGNILAGHLHMTRNFPYRKDGNNANNDNNDNTEGMLRQGQKSYTNIIKMIGKMIGDDILLSYLN